MTSSLNQTVVVENFYEFDEIDIIEAIAIKNSTSEELHHLRYKVGDKITVINRYYDILYNYVCEGTLKNVSGYFNENDFEMRKIRIKLDKNQALTFQKEREKIATKCSTRFKDFEINLSEMWLLAEIVIKTESIRKKFKDGLKAFFDLFQIFDVLFKLYNKDQNRNEIRFALCIGKVFTEFKVANINLAEKILYYAQGFYDICQAELKRGDVEFINDTAYMAVFQFLRNVVKFHREIMFYIGDLVQYYEPYQQDRVFLSRMFRDYTEFYRAFESISQSQAPCILLDNKRFLKLDQLSVYFTTNGQILRLFKGEELLVFYEAGLKIDGHNFLDGMVALTKKRIIFFKDVGSNYLDYNFELKIASKSSPVLKFDNKVNLISVQTDKIAAYYANASYVTDKQDSSFIDRFVHINCKKKSFNFKFSKAFFAMNFMNIVSQILTLKNYSFNDYYYKNYINADNNVENKPQIVNNSDKPAPEPSLVQDLAENETEQNLDQNSLVEDKSNFVPHSEELETLPLNNYNRVNVEAEDLNSSNLGDKVVADDKIVADSNAQENSDKKSLNREEKKDLVPNVESAEKNSLKDQNKAAESSVLNVAQNSNSNSIKTKQDEVQVENALKNVKDSQDSSESLVPNEAASQTNSAPSLVLNVVVNVSENLVNNQNPNQNRSVNSTSDQNLSQIENSKFEEAKNASKTESAAIVPISDVKSPKKQQQPWKKTFEQFEAKKKETKPVLKPIIDRKLQYSNCNKPAALISSQSTANLDGKLQYSSNKPAPLISSQSTANLVEFFNDSNGIKLRRNSFNSQIKELNNDPVVNESNSSKRQQKQKSQSNEKLIDESPINNIKKLKEIYSSNPNLNDKNLITQKKAPFSYSKLQKVQQQQQQPTPAAQSKPKTITPVKKWTKPQNPNQKWQPQPEHQKPLVIDVKSGAGDSSSNDNSDAQQISPSLNAARRVSVKDRIKLFQ